MGRIIQLSKDLINKIAAGEVIERPASVVKELVENSIDANASKIEITVTNDCLNLRIADNGSGIHPDDISLAFSKHATSKISKYNDLWEINSFGFRGEALSSIFSISRLTCYTRIKENDYAIKVESDDNIGFKTSTTASAIGTIFEIKDLFYNVPARLKFLKNPKTEFSYIQEVIQSLALANPDVSFTLYNNSTRSVHTSGSGALLNTICEIYSNSLATNLLKVECKDELSKLSLNGYISIPSFERSSKKSIHTFANKRSIKCSVFSKAIDNVYKTRMEKGKYPFIVLNLDIKPSDIDINVHPAKKEIRYKNPNQIFQFIFSSLDKTLSNASYLEKDDKIIDFSSKFKDDNGDDLLICEKQLIDNNQISLYSMDNPVLNVRPENNFIEPIFHNFNNIESTTNNSSNNFLNQDNNLDNINFKIIGQYLNTYIIFEEEDSLFIVDQHIADERYIYNQLKETKEISSQILLISDVFDLEPSDYAFLYDNKDFFKKQGYEYNLIDDNKLIFRKIPQVIAHLKIKDIFAQVVNCKDKSDIDLEERILITTACKAAIKAGQPLSLWQMQGLISKWKRTKDCFTCPHGRQIVHKFSQKDISGLFKRNID